MLESTSAAGNKRLFPLDNPEEKEWISHGRNMENFFGYIRILLFGEGSGVYPPAFNRDILFAQAEKKKPLSSGGTYPQDVIKSMWMLWKTFVFLLQLKGIYLLFNDIYGIVQCLVFPDRFLDLIHTMADCGMIPSSEFESDRFQRDVRHRFAEIHGDLSWENDFGIPFLSSQIGNRDVKMFGYNV